METHEKISKLREALGLTRNVFADRIGISANTLTSIEFKGVIPKSDVLIKISLAWPCYSLWLMTGEDAPLAGQFKPPEKVSDLNYENVAYQVIQKIDPRDLDQLMIKNNAIEKVIFLQTEDVAVSPKVKRLLSTTIFHRGKMASLNQVEIPKNIHWGTALLLILKTKSALGFRQAIVVRDGYFNLLNIEEENGKAVGLTERRIQKWLNESSIKIADIKSVNHLTLMALEADTDELSMSDLFDASEEAKNAFSLWRGELQ